MRSSGPLLTLLTGLILVVLAEIGLGWLAPMPDPYQAQREVPAYVPSAHRPDQVYRIAVEPALPGVQTVHANRINEFSTNSLGFRGDRLVRPKPADEYRIFMVGGSTTECIVLDDTHDVARQLQEALSTSRGGTVRVYNAGKSGDRSYDHLAMISQRIAHLEPDVLILFVGINDLTAGLAGVDYLHLEPRRLGDLDLLKLLAADSQIFRRVHAVARRFLRRSARQVLETIEFETNYAEKAALERSFPMATAAPRVNLVDYETNLRSILAIGRAAGTRIVLMTQATTWNSDIDPEASHWHWMRLRQGATYGEAPMDAALERYNDVTRRLAAAEDVELVDLAATMPKSLDFFYDDVHFNDAGARAAALDLAAQLETRPAVVSNSTENRGSVRRAAGSAPRGR